MTVETRRAGDVTVLAPRGRLVIGEGEMRLRGAVRDALEAGARKLLVDLGGATVIDSSGIGELVSAHTTVAARGGALKLANVPERTLELLRLTQLDTVFEIHGSEEEALAAF